MGYKMNSNIPDLLGINEELSTYDVPVFEKNMPEKVWGTANMDKTIHINKDLNKKDKETVVEHETEHILQMRKGLVSYDSNNVYWRGNPFQQFAIYDRDDIKEGDHKLPWEKAVYDKTKKYAK
jgi:hypothetical protein